MPLYDFRCDGDCGYFEDMFIPLAEKDAARCPDCSGTITVRIGAVITIGMAEACRFGTREGRKDCTPEGLQRLGPAA